MLHSTRNTFAEQMIRMGLQIGIVEDDSCDDEFSFPETLKGLRDLDAQRVCRLSVALRVVQKVHERKSSDTRVTPDDVSDFLVHQSLAIPKQIWINVSECLFELCMHLLPTNLLYADLRHLAEKLSTPEQFYAEARKYAEDRVGLTTLGIFDEDEMDVIGIDSKYVEDHSFHVSKAIAG